VSLLLLLLLQRRRLRRRLTSGLGGGEGPLGVGGGVECGVE